MKKLISFIIITLQIIAFIPWKTFANSKQKDRYFIVTAYYSPLPNQKHYLKWNFIAEKRLNWEWIKWASWKNVFSWMLAWPKWYKFWTKIYLDWLWVWEISDRWWAIVHAWNRWYKYDRIDLWVWYWEEGLKRALYWGKRKIKWEIITKKSQLTINIKKIPAPNWATKGLKQISSIFNTPLWKGSNKEKIKQLQEFLLKIWLYNWKIDWIYNKKIINTIYNFQIKNYLIKKDTDYWAGYWGYKTRNLILKKYLNWFFDLNKVKNKNIFNNTNIAKKLNIFNKPVKSKKEIKKLQNILKNLWFYNWKINWKYKDIKNIILKFQLENKIIKSKKQLWAWYFWPNTRKILKNKYQIYQEQLKEKQLEEKRKKQLKEKFKILENLANKQAKKEINLIKNPKFWEVSIRVRKLQQSLKKLWYFNYKDTAIFWKITKKSLIKYQLDKKIIKSKKNLAAGIFWPKTKKQLQKDLALLILNKKLINNEELAIFKKNNIKNSNLVKIDNKKNKI